MKLVIICGLMTLLNCNALFALNNSNYENEKDPMELPDLRSLRPMNGIDPTDYHEFWNNWDLVTTRYREDNGEQRFIYANKIGYKAMKEGVLKFPEGSAFAKLGFKTMVDPQFPNSREPINFTRVQIMVKDSERFKKTNGWSYFLYVDGVHSRPEDDEQKNLACHACHTIVKNKDYVFSAPSFLGKRSTELGLKGKKMKDFFIKRKFKILTKYERLAVASLKKKRRSYKVRRMRLFSGSLHESIGPLSSFSQNGYVYMVVDPVEKKFLIAEKLPANSSCRQRAQVFMTKRKKGVDYVRRGIVCNSQNKWIESKKF